MNKSCQIQVIREDRNENRAGWKESTIARPELHLTPKNEILRSAHQGRNVSPLQRATASSGLDPQRWCTGLSSCRGDAGLSAVSVCPSILPVPISAAEQGVSSTINLSVLTFPYFHASGFLRCDQSAWVSVPLWCCKVKVRASAACSTDFSAE